MSMSVHVIGIKPPDETFKKMLNVYNACKEAGVKLPDEVITFFDGSKPCEHGVKVYLNHSPDRHGPLCVANHDTQYDVDLTKLDQDIKILRFELSY